MGSPSDGADRRSTRGARVVRYALLGLLYYLAASAVLDSFADHWGYGDRWRKSRFHRAIHYRTERPFVYRVLTPALVNGVAEILPEKAAASLAERATPLREKYQLRQENDLEYVLAHYLTLCAYLGTILCWRWTLLRLWPDEGSVFRDVLPAAGLLLLPLTFMHGGFIYDPFELLFASLALAFFVARRWIGFYVAFLLAVLNKESNILIGLWLLPPFLRTRDWRGLFRHGAIASVVVLPAFLLVRWLLREYPGEPASFFLWEHLAYLASSESWLRVTFEPFATGIAVPRGLHVVNLLLLAGILWVARQRAPREILHVFLLTTLAILPLFLAFGWKDEIRVFGPAYPAFFVLAASCFATSPSRDPGDGKRPVAATGST
jgi:hypothetical protein